MIKKTLLALIFFGSLTLAGQENINEFEELANGYYNQGKLKQAAEFYSKAGYSYWNKNNEAKALASFQKAYDIFLNQNNINATITIGNNLGLLFLNSENYKSSYSVFFNVLAFTRKSKNKPEIFNALLNLGTVSLELNSFNEAISLANEALNLAKEFNNLKSIAKCYSILAESYDKMGDASSAYKYFELYSAIDKKIKAEEIKNIKQTSTEEVNTAYEKKRITEIELKIKKGELKLTQDSLIVSERLAFESQLQVQLRNEQLKKKELQLSYELRLRKNLLLGIIIIVFFLLIVGYFLIQKLKDNKKLNKQKEEITEQRNILDLQNKKITDSIHYGLRIQQAMLPNIENIQKTLDAFVIFRPKDIVSGDFYWFYEMKLNDITYIFIAVVDCTGHGVPGAFMSMIGHRLLSEIIIERNYTQPSQILERVNTSLRNELDQNNKKNADGMDIALCRISLQNGEYNELAFAGAKRPLLVYKQTNKNIELIAGGRKSIGSSIAVDKNPFTDTILKINSGDLVILFSDGVIDQPNPARDRFGSERFIQIIKENANEPMIKIQEIIENKFDLYKDTEEQRDDITIIGLRL